MKKLFIPAALSAVFAFTACDKPTGGETSAPDDNSVVKFSSSISSKSTRVANDQFASGDQVGIFMKGTNVPLNTETAIAHNFAYRPTTGNSLTPVGPAIQYPESGSVDFIAYYPYNRDAVVTTYTTVDDGNGNVTETKQMVFGLPNIDIRNQGGTEGGGSGVTEILYSNNATNKAASTNAVPLQFKYAFAKLKVTVSAAPAGALTATELSAMNVSLGGQCTMADFMLEYGTFERHKDIGPETITLRKTGLTPNGTGATFEALVFPSNDDEVAQTFIIYVNNQPYQKTVQQSFQGGYEYVIPFELTGGSTPEVYYLKGDAQINSRITTELPAQQVAFN
jgi:hypothetical protein